MLAELKFELEVVGGEDCDHEGAVKVEEGGGAGGGKERVGCDAAPDQKESPLSPTRVLALSGSPPPFPCIITLSSPPTSPPGPP